MPAMQYISLLYRIILIASSCMMAGCSMVESKLFSVVETFIEKEAEHFVAHAINSKQQDKAQQSTEHDKENKKKIV